MKSHRNIEWSVQVINTLPDDRAAVLSDFADLIIILYEEHELTNTIQNLADDNSTFDFLKNE